MSDPKGSATRGNLFEYGCIHNRYVSDPKGSATRGNLFEYGCIHNRYVSDPKGSATRGNLFKCGCIHNCNVYLWAYLPLAFLYEFFSTSFSSQLKSQLITAFNSEVLYVYYTKLYSHVI